MTDRRWVAGTIAGLALVGWAFAEDKVADGFLYRAKDGTTTAIAGVCVVDPEKADCWKPTGERSPRLTELVAASLILDRNPMYFHYHKRNLLLLTRTTNASRGGFYGPPQIRFPGGNSGTYSFTIDQGGEDVGPLNAEWFSTEPDTRMISVQAQFQSSEGQAHLEPKKGSRAVLGGHTFQVTDVTKTTPPEPGGFPARVSKVNSRRTAWLVARQVTPTVDEQDETVSYSLIGQNDQAVNQVDDKGNPVDNQGNGYWGPGMYYQPIQPAKDGWLLLANPEKVKSIQLMLFKHTNVTFMDIALFPKAG